MINVKDILSTFAFSFLLGRDGGSYACFLVSFKHTLKLYTRTAYQETFDSIFAVCLNCL